jgi:N-acetylneuraminic acid mutarotase
MAIVLENGNVLVAGGWGYDISYANTAELYDPSTRVWTNTGSMSQTLLSRTMSMLKNGKVLVAGGDQASTVGFNYVELYDPLTGNWTNVANMNYPRTSHTQTTLKNGKVLVAGGFSSGPGNTAELYTP